MRDYMNILNEGWLENQEAKHVAALMDKYPEIKPGQFVQLTTWFGDVWAEIVRVNYSTLEPKYNSVDYITYDKYGVGRQVRHDYFNKVRKIADLSEINVNQCVVYMKDSYNSHGHVVDWTGLNPPQNRLGHQKHPTLEKPVR